MTVDEINEERRKCFKEKMRLYQKYRESHPETFGMRGRIMIPEILAMEKRMKELDYEFLRMKAEENGKV